MVPSKLIKEIMELLDKAKNPLYFFDDDPDGLTSFLLLFKNYDKKGHGVTLKVGMKDERVYNIKIREYKPDLVVVLDRAEISQELINSIKVPLVWVDHHPPHERKVKYYLNPMLFDKEDNRPTSYWAYQLTGPNKDLLWIAAVGVSADWFVNEVTDEFAKKYPDILSGKIRKQGNILFDTNLGKLVKIFGFILKGETQEVKKSIRILSEMTDPYELLNQTTENSKYLNKRYEKVNKEYERVLEDASKSFDVNYQVLVYVHPSKKISLTGSISTELMHRFPNHVIILGREKGDYIYISLRSDLVPISGALEEALKHVRGYGGGHKFACGSSVHRDDFDRFLEEFKGALKL